MKLRRQLHASSALLTAVALAGCHQPAADTAQPVVTVQAEHPKRGDIAEQVVADATLSPLAQAAISPKITAPVRAFFVQRGSHVKAGQVLAELENRDLAAQALDNKGQYTAAQATYNMATKAQVPEDYAKAQLDVQQAKAQLDLQAEIAAARKKLFEQGALAGRDYDTAVAALAQAQTAYDAAQNHLEALTHVSRAASIELAQGQLSSAQGKYQSAQAQVSYSQIVSPISGVVTDRPLFAGETAAPGTPLVTVMDTSSLLAKVHLSQMLSQRLHVGDTASITAPGVDAPVPGTISLISPALDAGSTTVEVWLKLDNHAGTFKAGTPVHVSVKGRTAAQALTLPKGAVLTDEDGAKSVMVVRGDGAAHKVPVTLGIDDGQQVQVTHGLTGSEMVITQGAYGLDDGTKVKVSKPGQSEGGA